LDESGTDQYYWTLNLLWPNVDDIMKRLYEFVGAEIKCSEGEQSFLSWVLNKTAADLENIKNQGRIRDSWRDRDILVFFIRSLTRNLAKLYDMDVQAGGEYWPCGVEYFTQWRAKHPGEITVTHRNHNQELTVGALRKIAGKFMSARDWKILAEDTPRLWSEDGRALPDSYDYGSIADDFDIDGLDEYLKH